ncbi:hypothetical protein N7517_003993 [Penicillium concentricum]|uniref:Terpene synthase n=1 Tax=Penicillium concentricum TaxID=293559 RepID=A0A9W9S5C9_9EURO|nr:uncharacterized protein N7517_003993 [Penicillium concentricum]KAJ5371987.1 hypothetical protein N7517_003993 [Penicillium concentricum]
MIAHEGPVTEELLGRTPPDEPSPIDPNSHMCLETGSRAIDGENHSITLPDLFCSIMATKPAVNPHYVGAKTKYTCLIVNALQEDDEYGAKIYNLDYAYMPAICVPYCDEAAFQILVDYNVWVFLFDDQFDEGDLRDNPVAAQEEIESTMAIMNGTRPSVSACEDPLGYVFQTSNMAAAQHRIRETHREFFRGQLQQVKDTHDLRPNSRDVQHYLEMRRKTIGATATFTLCEIVLGINLPPHVRDHPCLQELSFLSIKMIHLVNDLISYRKDLEERSDHNLIIVLMEQGISTQDAVDKIGERLNDCYKRWYAILADLPIWGEEIDRQVLEFIDLRKGLALGNLHWSFKSTRYLGTDGEKTRHTRLLNLRGESNP